MDINAQNIIRQIKVTPDVGSSAIENMDKIEEAAKEFEAVFLSQMVSHMFESIETDPMFGGGQAEGIYRSMLIQEYGKAMAEAGGIGISDILKRELIAMQEGIF